MKIYTAKDIKLLGDPDPKYGQTYWGAVDEQKSPVKFNLMNVVDIMPGRKMMAEESEERKSAAGNAYTQLKKVKLSEVEGQAEELALDEDKPLKIAKGTITFPTDDETPSYEAGTNARWAIGMAYRAYQQVMGTPEDATGDFPFDIVKLHASELVRMFNELKNGPTGYEKAKAAREALGEEDDDGGE